MRKWKGILALLVFALLFALVSEARAATFWVPYYAYLGDEKGKEVVSEKTVDSGTTEQFYIYALDIYGGNDGVNSNDYYAVSSPDLAAEFTITKTGEENLHVAYSPRAILDNLKYDIPDNFDFGKQIGRIDVRYTNIVDADDDKYNYASTRFSLQLELKSGSEIFADTEVLPIVRVVRAGSGGDDGGGSCDALGLGAAALALPLLVSRRKK
ncbi:hypothetical protein FACS1894187_03040 [Synergistales bacterium]|nr:hypothetical protein FACS1894187_03040 [Synergistales bacterium]